MQKIYKIREICTVYNISQPNFTILLISLCSFWLWSLIPVSRLKLKFSVTSKFPSCFLYYDWQRLKLHLHFHLARNSIPFIIMVVMYTLYNKFLFLFLFFVVLSFLFFSLLEICHLSFTYWCNHVLEWSQRFVMQWWVTSPENSTTECKKN